MADYECAPLWWSGAHDPGNVDPHDLPLSESTRNRLAKWAKTYDATLNQDDPRQSGFRTLAEAEAFESEGLSLCHQLRKELSPAYRVYYFSIAQRRLLRDDEIPER